MMWLVIEAMIAAFDIYIIGSFFYRRLNKLASVRAIILLSAACAICRYGLYYIEFPVFLNIMSTAAVCFIMSFMFDASRKQRLLYPIVISALEIIAEITAGLLVSGIFGMPLSEITADVRSVEYLIGKIISKLIFFVFIRILCRLHVKNDSTRSFWNWLLIMLVPFTSMAICMGFSYCMEHCIINGLTAPFIVLIGIIGINVLTFIMYDELSAQSKILVEHERSKNRMESDLRQYNAIILQSKEFAALLHDSQKHRETVRDLLASDDNGAALLYMDRLLTFDSPIYYDTIVKNSPVVDMILRRKSAEAARNAIKVICNYETESVLPIDDISLCLIFGNAMDNAIDACLKLPEGKDRRIDIDVRYENDRLTIRIANTSGPVNIVNNACATTKRNSMLHGYGLLNIQKTVVEKGGNSVIHYDDDMFILSIIFLL